MKLGRLTLFFGAGLTILSANAQTNDDEDGRFAFGGYGETTYTRTEDVVDSFKTKFVPIFLVKVSDKLHVEAELEFSIGEDGETETELEYGDIHYFINDQWTFTAGKFLLPFGQFGANLHPSWINKLPSVPGTYGGHGGNGLMSGVIPVLSDTGVAIQFTQPIGKHSKWFFDLYLVNGAREEVEEHSEEAEVGEIDGHGENLFPEIEFEGGSSDNNDNKALGGRVGLAFLPEWEVGYSFYRSKYDASGDLSYNASAFDINWISDYVSVRGEYIRSEADALVEELHEGEYVDELYRIDRSGWYIQGTYSLRQLNIESLNTVEAVVRHSRLKGIDEGERWTYGVNYWLSPSTALKFAFEDTKMFNGDKDTRVFAQFAYGF